MRKNRIALICTVAAFAMAVPAFASANPLGALRDFNRMPHVSATTPTKANCAALRRDSRLRNQMTPSQRREHIAQCELLSDGRMIAAAAPGTRSSQLAVERSGS